MLKWIILSIDCQRMNYGHVYSLTDGDDVVLLAAFTNTNPFQVSRWLLQTPTPSQMPQGVEGTDAGLAPWEYGSSPRPSNSPSLTIWRRQSHRPSTPHPNSHGQSRQRQKTGMGPKVYIQAQMDDDTDLWRSEILAGRLALKDAAA